MVATEKETPRRWGIRSVWGYGLGRLYRIFAHDHHLVPEPVPDSLYAADRLGLPLARRVRGDDLRQRANLLPGRDRGYRRSALAPRSDRRRRMAGDPRNPSAGGSRRMDRHAGPHPRDLDLPRPAAHER